jgi:hypothetical protein
LDAQQGSKAAGDPRKTPKIFGFPAAGSPRLRTYKINSSTYPLKPAVKTHDCIIACS